MMVLDFQKGVKAPLPEKPTLLDKEKAFSCWELGMQDKFMVVAVYFVLHVLANKQVVSYRTSNDAKETGSREIEQRDARAMEGVVMLIDRVLRLQRQSRWRR